MRIVPATLVLAAVLTTGCVSVYTPEIQQGNVVTQEMVDKLKPGMTKAQVRFVLGTPLVIDPFHQDRWDYVYYIKKNFNAPAQARQLTVLFKGDALTKLLGDVNVDRAKSPAGTDAAKETVGAPAKHAAPALPLSRY